MIKSIFASKTIWVNSLTFVATATGFFAGSLSSYPTLVCYLMLAQAAANVILRLVTKTAVTVTPVAKG